MGAWLNLSKLGVGMEFRYPKHESESRARSQIG